MRSVIALAYKRFDAAAGAAELRELPRAAMEAELEYGGFAVFQCPLKVRIWHLYLITGILCSPYTGFSPHNCGGTGERASAGFETHGRYFIL